MSAPFISFDAGEALLDWTDLAQALADGHAAPKAEIGDTFLYRGKDTLLSRAAWIDGLGALVKTATIFPGNTDAPPINGAVSLFSDATGELEAMIDFHLVTKWKTAADSLLGAMRLKPKAARILIVGAGTVAASIREAFGAGYPGAQFTIWNRTAARAEALAARYSDTDVADDLAAAVQAADIIVGCTMTTDPWLRGDWLRPGQHVNLIGAYRPDMREADDSALRRARVFVDSFDTTIGHIGEIEIPLAAGTIARDHLVADYYDLSAFAATDTDITLFKNGGGAHLDLMTCRHILTRWQGA